jgi:uncharacterized damage-inducible protein DinB
VDSQDAARLFDFTYWANRALLDRAAEITDDQWTSPMPRLTRNLRGTLVHELDVEWSWRLRLMGEPPERWGPEAELREEDFPTVASLAERWAADEVEMRAWLGSLTDEAIESIVDLGGRNRLPLSAFLNHIVVHGVIQRADGAALLTDLGHSPGDLEYLDYVDSIQGRST